MAKCPYCGKKAKRSCPAQDTLICSACCGAKRQKEITCPEDCDFLPAEDAYALREVDKLVTQHFNREEEDIFQLNSSSRMWAFGIENFFLKYAQENSLRDREITLALKKQYCSLTMSDFELFAYTDFEKTFFEHFMKMETEFNLDEDIRPLTLLRILKSIRNCTGGVFGDHGYQKMIKMQNKGIIL